LALAFVGDFFQGKGGGLQQPAQTATTKREMGQGSMFLDFFGFFEQQNKKCLLLEGGNKDFKTKISKGEKVEKGNAHTHASGSFLEWTSLPAFPPIETAPI
jgi:hypothetical protein